MFIYARSEQCDVGPIYTTRRIRIYPGKLKFIMVKISQDPGRLHGKHAKENQTLFKFLTTENFISGLPCSHERKYGAYPDLSSYAVNLPWVNDLHRDINEKVLIWVIIYPLFSAY